MKIFKRIFALLLALLLTLPTGMVIHAEENEPEKAYHPLITHWDFEGEGDAVYADKANGTDTLTAVGSVTYNKETGTVTIPSTAKTYLYASSAEGTDLYSLKNKTIVIRAKLSDSVPGKRTSVSGFMGKANSFAYGLQGSTTDENENYSAGGAISYVYYNGNKNGACSTIASETQIVMDEFRTFAMSFSYKVIDGKQAVVATQYMSDENGEFITMSSYDLETVSNQSTTNNQKGYKNVDGCIENENNFLLGKRYDGETSTTDRKLNVEIDDVKIYEGVLTPAQLVDDNTPTFRASQIATPKSGVTAAGTFAVRFVGTVNAVTMDTLGYTITANAKDVVDKDLSGTVKNVYGAISASTEKGVQGYSARADFYSGGIFTYTIYDIPTSLLAGGGSIEFEVTPYSETGDDELVGESYIVKIELVDGEELDLDDYNSYKTTITKK